MPHYCVAYSREITSTRHVTHRPIENKSKGDVSYKAGVRIRNSMNWLVYFSKNLFVARKAPKKSFWFKLNFVTLTLSSPQVHTDEYIVTHMLQPFLKYIARKYGAKNYIWKAEIQPDRLRERGERCIHFHITTNKFIPKEKARNKWNQLQVAHGYLKKVDNSPSTEVKAVIKIGKIVSYMAKYIMKKPESKELCVTCKVWGCNHLLSRLSVIMKEEDCSTFGIDIGYFIDRFVTKKNYMDYCAVYYTDLKRKATLPQSISDKIAVARDIFESGENNVVGYVYEDSKPLREIKQTERKKVVHQLRLDGFDTAWNRVKSST